ncbi:MAG: hypothetical protein WCP22_09210 [Chlamydiota bacterium]
MTSPFAKPQPGLRVKPGGPPIQMPTQEEAAAYPAEAAAMLGGIQAAQAPAGGFRIDWMRGRHFLIAGGTGSGFGGCVAQAVLAGVGETGSLTVVSRDPSRSVAYETGILMQERAARDGMGARFHWINYGLAAEGKKFDRILAALREAGADRVVYVNAVAAAHSGLLPGFPPVYVKDLDEEGLFQWELLPLDERAIEATRVPMGELAAAFAPALEQAGVAVEATVFLDWRGSLDRGSRDPASPDYGRQGPYSTSLYIPKEIIRAATAAAIGRGRTVLDIFLPVMHTRALGLIPGGALMPRLFDSLMKREGVRRVDAPELALAALHRAGLALGGGSPNPFPRLDLHEAALDLWFIEVLTRLNEDPESEFHYRRWI